MAAEKETLVTDFGSLRVGMIVVYRPCGFCGGRHRTQLQRIETGQHLAVNAETGDIEIVSRWWLVDPHWKCQPKRRAVISQLAVNARKIWRVEDGLEAGARGRTLELISPGSLLR